MSSDPPEPSSAIEPPSPTPSTLSTITTNRSTSTAPSSSGLIPDLTEPWSRPETCGYTYDIDHPPGDGDGPTAYLDWAIDEDATTFSCYPPGMFESGNSGTFSPASCPFSWYTVDKPHGSDSSEPETTTRTCCSKEFTLNDGFCQKAIPTILATPVTHLTSATSASSSYMTEMTTYLVSATVAHHPLVILFQEKDQDVLGLVDDDLAHSDAPSSASSSSSSDGLGLGAKVGIGVGVAGIVSLLVLLAYYLLRRKRHLSEKASLETATLPHSIPACRSSASSSATSLEGLHARRQAGPDPDPPPAYEPSPQQLSPRGSVENQEPSEDELQSLRAQQEAIRRRIEQLERGPEG